MGHMWVTPTPLTVTETRAQVTGYREQAWFSSQVSEPLAAQQGRPDPRDPAAQASVLMHTLSGRDLHRLSQGTFTTPLRNEGAGSCTASTPARQKADGQPPSPGPV